MNNNISIVSPSLLDEGLSNDVPSMLSSSSCSLVYGMVPFVTAILSTMLPMLNLAKQDNMKWVFSSGKILPVMYFYTVILPIYIFIV